MDRRQELTEFLKSRRARVKPEDLGLQVFGGRRRVPGLRREELAQAAGVSADYYVRLEQGRAGNVSDSVLAAVAGVLGLDEAERAHLAVLTRPAGRPRRRPAQRVRPAVRQLLAAMDTVPAFVLGNRMDVLAWNHLAAALITDFDALAPGERNMARLVFSDEAARQLYPQWELVAAEIVAYLRAYTGRHPGDPELAELVGTLTIHSAEFRRLWSRHDVRDKSFGSKLLRHPVVGDLTVQYETLRLPGDPDQLLVAYSTEPGSPSEQALRLLASWAAPAATDRPRRAGTEPEPADLGAEPANQLRIGHQAVRRTENTAGDKAGDTESGLASGPGTEPGTLR